MTSSLPAVLVCYALGSASPADIVEAADGLCEVIFVVDGREKHTQFVLPFIEELTETLDLARLSEQEVADRVAGRVWGITTYSEFMLAETARMAERLMVPFQSLPVVEALTDKVRQRGLLNDSGLIPLRQLNVAGPAEFEPAARELGLPVVIKPARGTASANVYRLTSWADMAAIVPSVVPGGWVVEEMLPAGRHPSSPWLGDYCSVETAVSDGDCWHFAVVERLPLSPPFRETGMLTPDSLPVAYREQVLAVAESAIHAVGMTSGIAHVEIKFAPEGPRVIEVNGRLGGTAGRLLRRVSDLNPIQLALQIALGQKIEPRDLVFDRYALAYHILPPLRPVTVRTAVKPASFRAMPEVWAVDGGVRTGQHLDWRRGGLERLFTVLAEVDRADALPSVIHRLESAAAECVEYED